MFPACSFEKLLPMVVGALLFLLGARDDDTAVHALAASVALPALRQPFRSDALFTHLGRVLINSAGEATLLVARMPAALADSQMPQRSMSDAARWSGACGAWWRSG